MPPTQTIHFDPAGGPLRALPSAGQAAPGSYGLLLVEPDGLTVVPPSPFTGQFTEAAATTHPLPGTAPAHDGRILDLLASVGLMDATRAFAVHLTILQDGNVLGTASDTGIDTGTDPTHESEILVVLSATAPAQSVDASLRSLIARPARAVGAPLQTPEPSGTQKTASEAPPSGAEQATDEAVKERSAPGGRGHDPKKGGRS